MYYVDGPTRVDLLLGYTTVLLVLEATRRSVGLALLTALAFIVYALTVGSQGPGWISDLIGLGALAAVVISQQGAEGRACAASRRSASE
jgi:TRAP-type uncharacterized transport system fused permease subunit